MSNKYLTSSKLPPSDAAAKKRQVIPLWIPNNNVPQCICQESGAQLHSFYWSLPSYGEFTKVDLVFSTGVYIQDFPDTYTAAYIVEGHDICTSMDKKHAVPQVCSSAGQHQWSLSNLQFPPAMSLWDHIVMQSILLEMITSLRKNYEINFINFEKSKFIFL
jgi:hypothetical protein